MAALMAASSSTFVRGAGVPKQAPAASAQAVRARAPVCRADLRTSSGAAPRDAALEKTVLAAVLASSLAFTYPGAAEASPAYDRCTTDACREIVLRMEATRAEKQGSAPAVAAESARPTPKKPEPKKSSPPNPFVQFLGWSLATGAGTTVLAAGAVTASTGSFSELTSGNFSGWATKSKEKISGLDNKAVILAAAGTLIGVDALLHAVPIINWFSPGLLEFTGVLVAAAAASRYVEKKATIEADVKALESSLPKALPPVSEATGALSKTATTAVDFVKAVKWPEIPTDAGKYWESLDNKVNTVTIGSLVFVGAILLDGIAHWPVLGLIFPTAFELVGVATLLAAANRYALEEKSIQADATAFVSTLGKAEIPYVSAALSKVQLPSAAPSKAE